jgi:small subunit ribosomal protein S9
MPTTSQKTTVAPTPETTATARQATLTQPSGKYFSAVGRRKTSVANAKIYETAPEQAAAAGNFFINGKPYVQYFSDDELKRTCDAPLRKLKLMDRFSVTIKVTGGGIRGQAEAIRNAVSRAIVKFDAESKKRLRRSGFITRDPRMKERKKYGLKSARRAPQWSKR